MASVDSAGSAKARRVRDVFAGRRPDRVPICEQAFASSVAGRILGREAYTGSTDLFYHEALAWMRGDAAHEEFVEQVYRDVVDLHRALDFDILFLPWRQSTRPTRQIDEHTFLYGDPDGDDWWVGRFAPDSRTFARTASARPDPSVEDVAAQMRATVRDREKRAPRFELDPLRARALKEHPEYVLPGGAGMAIPMQPAWLEATVLERELVADYLDVAVDGVLAALEAQREAGIWYVNGGGDFAFKSGPIYSPDFFESVMAPRWKRIFDRCRELDMLYVMRSDGNLWPVADALFGRARPHGYGEIDHDAGMRFDALRRAFPDLVLVGNVSCNLLVRGTPEQVRAQALECIRCAAPRVILSSANAILHGTPVENVYALYGAAAAGAA
jgi:hypothetical protein